MKLLIASDIHGSEYYGNKLIERFINEGANKLLLLGDILYHGPRNDLPLDYKPKALIESLNELKDRIISVRGNCDSEVDQMVLEFPIMGDYAILEIDGKNIFATHGHIYNENKLPPLGTCDILLNGHTHIPMFTQHETYTYMNPGSVSIPKNNSWHGYMIYDEGKFIWKDLDGKCQMEYSLK